MSDHICPECVAGKHKNCDGTTWDNETDGLIPCACTFTDNHPQVSSRERTAA